MEKAQWLINVGIFILETGNIIKRMEMVFSPNYLVKSMKVNGEMINKQDKES